MTDKELLDTYLQGFKDEWKNQSLNDIKDKQLRKAYDLGKNDALREKRSMPDFFSTDEDILKRIKDENDKEYSIWKKKV